jgi:hypothetical protein
MPVTPQAGLAGAAYQRQGVGFDPIGTLGELARMKTLDLQQQKADLELRDFKRQREMEAKMQAELAEAGDDPSRIISILNRYNPKLAADVSKSWQEGQVKALEAEKSALEIEGTRMDQAGRILRAFDDLDPASPDAATLWQTLYPSMARLAGEEIPLPEQYDPALLPALQKVLADGKAYNDMRAESVKAYDSGDRLRAIALRLSAATTPEQWAEAQQLGRFMGVPRQDLELFGEFSPENVAKAQQMTIAPEKQAELAGQSEQRDINRGQLAVSQGQLAVSQGNLAVRREEARKTGGAQDESTRNLAALVARSPDVLQGLTPTLAGTVLKQMASDPELLAQYENTRMAPLRERSQSLLSAVNKLVTADASGKAALTPGAKRIFGEYTPVSARSMIPGREATDAAAALEQVLGQQVVDLISDMKAQSRTGATGFGQLSVRELEVLQSAATQLTRRLSEPAALRELSAIQESLQKILKDGPRTSEAGYSGEVRQAADGRLLGMVNGAVVEVERVGSGYRVKR